jgi:hypothetical protein
MLNPLHPNPANRSAKLSPKEERYILSLRAARKGARRVARSGSPRKRAEAQDALARIPDMILETYIGHLRRKGLEEG